MTRVYRWSVTCDEDGCSLWWASFAVAVNQQRAAARDGGWRLGRREDLCPDHNPKAVPKPENEPTDLIQEEE